MAPEGVPQGSVRNPNRILFVTMGMFIIDEIHYGQMSTKPAVFDIIGGAGTYSVLGCRFFFPSSQSRSQSQSQSDNMIITKKGHSDQIGWIIDVGNDFPDTIRTEIESWNTGVVWRDTPQRQTTRGWNYYGPNQERDFKYTTPKLRIEVEDFQTHRQLLHSQSFHLICTPNRCIDICTKISRGLKLDATQNGTDTFETPVLIWEPVPGATSPTTFSECLRALAHVDVLSPNAKEAADFLGLAEPETEDEVRKVALQFLVHMKQPRIGDVDEPQSESVTPAYPRAIVVRCGAKGCTVFSFSQFPTGQSRTDSVTPTFFDSTLGEQTTLNYYEAQFPAYHSDSFNDDYIVEDPTGGGNTFLGGFTAGYLQPYGKDSEKVGNLAKAAIYGNIAAGLAIEQVGVPRLETGNTGETWNGRGIDARLQKYLKRHGFDDRLLE